MASYDAAINLIVNGSSKIDKVISKAVELESIAKSISKTPIEVNVKQATAEFDRFDTQLKAVRANIDNQKKAVDLAGKSIAGYTDKIVASQSRLSQLNPNTKRYNQVLERQRKEIEGLAGAQRDLIKAQSALAKSETEVGPLVTAVKSAKAAKQTAEVITNLADDYLRLGAAQDRARKSALVSGLGVRGTTSSTQLAPTIAQLNAQAEALQLIASNSKIASSEFNRFTIASQVANQRQFEARQQQLGALAFGLSGQAPRVNIGVGGEGSIAASRNLVTSAIGSYGQIVKSEAALSSYSEQLRSLQSLVPYASNEFRVLEEAIANVNEELSQIGLRGQKSAIQSLAGPAIDLGSLKAFQLRESYQKKVNDQLNIQEAIQERISQATLFDFQKKKLTLQLDEAVAALAENRLGDAQRLTREIDRQRISMERMNRAAQKPQVFGALGTGFMPVTGELPPTISAGGQKIRNLAPGSPAAKLEEAKANRESTQAAVALAQQKQKAIEAEAEALRKGTQAATALGKQKLKALEDEANRLRQETSNAVALAQQRMREEEKLVQAWQRRGGPALPPLMGGGAAGARGQAFRAGGPGAATAALSAPRRVESLVRSAQLAQEKLTELEIRGVDVTSEKASVQKIINSLKQKDLQVSDQLLNNADDELNIIRDVLRLEKQRITNQRLLSGDSGSKKTGPESTGLEAALKRLEEARGARQKFLGDVSAPEAIDKIVREFNKGKPGSGAGANVVNTLLSETTAGVPKAAAAGEQLGQAVEDGLNDGLGIQSPSKVATEAMLNVINTLVNTARSGKAKVQAALEDLVAPKLGTVQQAPLLKSLTATTQETVGKLANFIGRASAKPSLYRPLARLAGSELLSGGAVPQAMQRKAFEAGKVLPETRLLPLSERRLLRGSISAPGGGLESEILRAALRGVSGTGAFVGPLASSVRSQGVVASRLFSGLSQGPAGVGGTGIFPVRPQQRVGAPGSAFPFQSYRMGGAQQFPVDEAANLLQKSATRGDANRALTDAIGRYRNAVNNFWEGEDSQFEAVLKVVKSGVQLGGAKLARKLTESGRGAGISQTVDRTVEGISDSVLNSVEALGATVSNSIEDGIDAIRTGIPSAVSRAFGGVIRGFGGGGGNLPPGGGGGPTRDPGDFNRRLSTAAEQGAEALLGLQELRDPTKATTIELEALSGVLKEFRKILDPTSEGFERLEKQLRETAANLDRQLERRAPDAGFLTRQFGPRTARGLSEGLIGGAFPLLFGQGIGASIGGAAGGFGGGFLGGGLGFGLSLVGTAAGTAIDATAQSAIDLGKALENPAENFQVLADRSLISSKALEKQIEKTIEAGNVATASALIQEDLIKRLGSDGVAKLKAAAEASDRLNRAWSELSTAIQTAIAGPLAGFLEWVKSVVDAAGQRPKQEREIKETFKQLPDKYQEEFNKEVQRRIDAIRVASPATGSQPSLGSLQGVDNGLPRQQGVFDNALSSLEITPLVSPQAIQDIRAQVAKEFESKKVPVAIEVTKEQLDQGVLNVLEKELQAINIIDSVLSQVRSANREQQDLDKQRAELVRSYEESIGDIRKRVEDEIRNRRLAVLETENQILDQQGQNRISQLRLINQQFVASAGQGQRPEVEDAAKRAAQIVAQFTEQQLSAEEEAAQVKRNAALDALKFDTQAAEFRANIEKEVSRLNIETARRVADINQQVARRNEDASKRRFEIEKQIAQIQLERVVAEFKGSIENLKKQIEQYKAAGLDETQPGIIAGRNQIAVYEAQMKEYNKAIKEIDSKSLPPLRGIPEGSIGGQGVSTGQLDAIVRKEKDAANRLVNEILAGLDLTKATDFANFKNQIADLAKSFNAPIVAFAQNFNDELQASSRYIELLNQGLKGTTAQQVIQVEQARAIAIAQYNQAIASLEQKKNAKETSELAKGNIESQIVDLQNARDALLGAVSTAVNDVVLNQSIIAAREAMKAMKEEMNELLDKVNRARFASETLGQGIAGGITGSISALTGVDTITQRREVQAQIDQLEKLKEGAKGNSDAIEEYNKKIAEARSEMNKLKDTGTQVQNVLANMLKGIADAFIDMAKRIIAQQITMVVFGTILKALGIAASAGSNMSQSGITENTLAPMRQYPVLEGAGFTPSAKGSYFADGVAAFANGGMFTNSVVSSPTLFQFADGGVTRTGLMGEAGPEAIMPLERGPDGKLGVAAHFSENRQAMKGGSPGEPASAFSENRDAINATATVERERMFERVISSGASSTEIKYSRVGSGDLPFVTEEDMLQASRIAAQEGARLGQQRTLAAIKNNPAIRRGLGV